MKSDNFDVIITWKEHTKKNANKMPIYITCQSWHIPKSKGYFKLYCHFLQIITMFFYF